MPKAKKVICIKFSLWAQNLTLKYYISWKLLNNRGFWQERYLQNLF